MLEITSRGMSLKHISITERVFLDPVSLVFRDDEQYLHVGMTVEELKNVYYRVRFECEENNLISDEERDDITRLAQSYREMKERV